MIPVTAFAGKKVAVFGLGGSGLATAQGADGRRRRRVTPGTTIPTSVAKAAERRHSASSISAAPTGAASPRFVLSPGVPLTHPKPHWTVDLARGGRRRDHRRHRAVLPRAATRMRRTRRFVAITGTNGKSTTTALIAHILSAAGRDVQLGGNIGTAVLTLDPPRAEPHLRDRMLVLPDRSRARSLNPTAGILLNLTPDHLDRHGTMQHYAAIKERLVAEADDRRSSASTTAICAGDRRPCSSRRARMSCRISHAACRWRDGVFSPTALMLMRADAGRVDARSPTSTASGRCAAQHNAQNAAAAVAACLLVGLERERDPVAGLTAFPACRTAWSRSAAAAACSSSTIPRRPTPMRPRRRLPSFDRIYWIAGGLPKEGGIDRLRRFFPRIAKAYLIGEAAPSHSPRRSAKRCRTRFPARSTLPSPHAAADARAMAPASRSCCSRRPAQASTSSRISRCAATLSALPVQRARRRHRLIGGDAT